MTRISDIISQYGHAYRGDYSWIDGRTVENDMSYIAGQLKKIGTRELTEEEALEMRKCLGLCPHGGYHWDSWCGSEYVSCRE